MRFRAKSDAGKTDPTLARKLLAHYEMTSPHLDMRSVLDKIAESLAGEVTIESDWLSEHVGVLPEDQVRIDPQVWTQLAEFIERRAAVRVDYQTFTGRRGEYELHPYHLLAYHGNWYVLARVVTELFLLFIFGCILLNASELLHNPPLPFFA